MNRLSRFAALSVALSCAVSTARAQQQRPPIRELGAVTAASKEVFINVTGVRALSNGSIIVNDPGQRRVVMFDPQLSALTVIADSTSATANAYGGRVGALISYRGDSTVFIDPQSVSMLVIDPSGKVARVMAIPRAEDAFFIGSVAGNAMVDASGRLFYRAIARPQFGARMLTGTPGAPPPIPDIPDSAFIIRIDLATRKVDTVAAVRTPKVKLETKTDERGTLISTLVNPLPVVDEWTVTSDGAVALIRGHDYHVDWINPDGSKTSSAKIPFDWQRMTDEDKSAFIDSVKAARERLGNSAPAPGVPQPGGVTGVPQMQVFIGSGGPGGGPQQIRAGAGGPGQPAFSFIPASELPDYKPPFFAGSVRADADGNVWVRTIPTSAIAGGPVYDVINRRGELVDRVQLPAGRTIVGFGAGGLVVLANRDGANVTIERATVR